MPDNLAPATHGGDLAAIGRRYGISPDTLLDFSANVNALGPPASLLRALAAAASDAAALRRYPDSDCAPLRDALVRRLGVAAEALVIGNGAAALLDAAVRVRRLRRCLVPVPAFSEYARALAAARVEFVRLPLGAADDFQLRPAAVRAACERGDVDACLFSNPHNPSGALVPRADVERIARSVRAAGGLTIVDEAFIDFAPGESITTWAATSPGVIAVRSLTKFFAVPALRVGYAVCEPALARDLRAVLPPWPVTTFVCEALAAALDDTAYAERSIFENERGRERLAASLRELGLRVSPSAANFLLLELPAGTLTASELVERLIVRDKLVLRDCGSYDALAAQRYVRVAVRSRADNERLLAALGEVPALHKEPGNGAPM